MIPDLGKYAGTVLAAYGFSFLVLGLLVAATLLRGASVRRELEKTEARVKGKQDG